MSEPGECRFAATISVDHVGNIAIQVGGFIKDEAQTDWVVRVLESLKGFLPPGNEPKDTPK